MGRWPRGEADIEQLIAEGRLEPVTGAGADGSPLLEQARKTAATAAGLVQDDPYSAFVLAYDAARFACAALLAQQGLRSTVTGGHLAVENAVRAQFGDGFRPFGALRRRRNELEYLSRPADTTTPEEAEQAAKTAQQLVEAAGKLLPELSFFSKLTRGVTEDLRRADLGPDPAVGQDHNGIETLLEANLSSEA